VSGQHVSTGDSRVVAEAAPIVITFFQKIKVGLKKEDAFQS